MNEYIKFALLFVIVVIISKYYRKYQECEQNANHLRNYDMIKKYLLEESSLGKSDKPILWIHIEFEKNARWWSSFYSRSSECLNQPYKHLTIKSIIDTCGDSFNICLIDDKTFNNIVPGWTTKVAGLPYPLRPHLRELAMSKLLYSYGGMTIPSSFLCFKDVISLYNRALGCGAISMFSGEMKCMTVDSSYSDFAPSHKIMGCHKESLAMKEYINYLENQVSIDYTNEMDFVGYTDRKLYEMAKDKKIMTLDASYFGVQDKHGDEIFLEDILEDNESFALHKNAYGLYIPDDEILRRTKYQWFARLDPEQVLDSNTVVGKCMLEIMSVQTEIASIDEVQVYQMTQPM